MLAFMLGATNTANGPEVAPVGIVMVIEVALQVLMVAGAPFSITALLPCEAPKPVPVITTWLPTDPEVVDRLVITGAGEAVELTDTLSNVAVPRLEVLSSLTAKPM